MDKPMHTVTETYVRITIYTPDPKKLNSNVLSKPFVLYTMPEYATIMGNVVTLPNILELMGGSSGGGGPPGFSAQQYKGRVREKRPLMLLGFMPGNEVKLFDEHFSVGSCVGTAVSAAVALTYFTLAPVGDAPETMEETAALIEKAGYAAIPLIEYETPQMILNAIKALPVPVPGVG